MANQSGVHGYGYGRRESAEDGYGGDATELAVFGAGVLAVGSAAAVALWRLVALLSGGV